jgi:uncharacterized metal-binding protein
MCRVDLNNDLRFTPTTNSCPIGEITGKKNTSQAKIPVLSCEGACIRGEIARLAANIVSRAEPYGRGCHGELVTVPESAIARWIKTAQKVILIDGCFLRCHGRILENIIDERKLIQFDALAHHKKYSDIFDYDDVPEAERREVAQSVAAWVLKSLENASAQNGPEAGDSKGSCSSCCG